MNLFEQVLSKQEKNIVDVLEDSLSVLEQDVIRVVEQLLIHTDISYGFIDKLVLLEEELREPQMLDIVKLPKKRQEAKDYLHALSSKSHEISTLLKVLYPTLFSKDSKFRQNLQILFSKATLSKFRDEVSNRMQIFLDALDNILKLFKDVFKLESLSLRVNQDTIEDIKLALMHFQVHLVSMHDELFYLKSKPELFDR